MRDFETRWKSHYPIWQETGPLEVCKSGKDGTNTGAALKHWRVPLVEDFR